MKPYYIATDEVMGRCVHANKPLSKGDVVMISELIVLSSIDTVKIGYTDLKHYTFKYSDNNDCLVLGDGELFNHDNNANVSYHLEDFFGRKRMVFTALTDILEQTQLFIDYGADTAVDTDSYVNAKSLIG